MCIRRRYGCWCVSTGVGTVQRRHPHRPSRRLEGAGRGEAQAGTSAAGTASAQQVLAQLAGGPLHGVAVTTDRVASSAPVRISGTATSVVPFLRPPRARRGSRPIERFVADTRGLTTCGVVLTAWMTDALDEAASSELVLQPEQIPHRAALTGVASLGSGLNAGGNEPGPGEAGLARDDGDTRGRCRSGGKGGHLQGLGSQHCLGSGLRRIGWDMPGGFAEQVVVPAENTRPLANGATPLHATLADPAAVAIHGLRCNAVGSPGRLAVVGAGTVGLLTAHYADEQGWKVTVVHRDGRPPVDAVAEAIPAAFRSPRTLSSHQTFDVVVDAASGADPTPLDLALRSWAMAAPSSSRMPIIPASAFRRRYVTSSAGRSA